MWFYCFHFSTDCEHFIIGHSQRKNTAHIFIFCFTGFLYFTPPPPQLYRYLLVSFSLSWKIMTYVLLSNYIRCMGFSLFSGRQIWWVLFLFSENKHQFVSVCVCACGWMYMGVYVCMVYTLNWIVNHSSTPEITISAYQEWYNEARNTANICGVYWIALAIALSLNLGSSLMRLYSIQSAYLSAWCVYPRRHTTCFIHAQPFHTK